jgi:hypothetical protein
MEAAEFAKFGSRLFLPLLSAHRGPLTWVRARRRPDSDTFSDFGRDPGRPRSCGKWTAPARLPIPTLRAEP